MTDTVWTAVDRFLAETLLGEDAVLDAILVRNAANGLPEIDVSPTHGRFLTLLARIVGARRVLEIGTLGGYSAVCLARGLTEGGRLISLEYEPHHAKVARVNIAAAGMADRVEVRLGRAIDLLPDVEGPFDLSFIDADKASTPAYLDWAVRLSRPGAVIVCDNVVRQGAVVDPARRDPHTEGVRKALRQMGEDPRLDATALQTVGAKGYDGFALARVR